MKKLKFIGIITLAALFAFSTMACSGSGGGKSLNSATELKEYLDKQPGNSPEQPIKVAMKANDMMIVEIVGVIKGANKYVSLNLSGSPLTEIPRGAFNECKTLVDITIPNSVTSIGDNAFMNCTSLTSVTIPNSVTSIGESAFAYTSLTSITIPNSVASIESYAFRNCTSLTSVTIPNSVIEIYRSTFYGCTSLITVDSPNYTVEGGILYNKAKTEIVYALNISGNVTIPNSVTQILNGAFQSNQLMTSIIIPNSVTSIGADAFGNCRNLTSVTFQGTITSADFHTNYNQFSGDLRVKYLAGGIGTYTTTAPVRYDSVWTKQ